MKLQTNTINPTNTRQEGINQLINSLIVSTEPGVYPFPSQDELGKFTTLIVGVTGQEINAATALIFESWFEKVEFGLLIEAARRTGLYARRPSVHYWNAILKNWQKQGITCVDDLAREYGGRRHDAASSSNWWSKSLTAHNHDERQYSEEDYKNLFYNPLDDYKPEKPEA